MLHRELIHVSAHPYFPFRAGSYAIPLVLDPKATVGGFVPISPVGVDERKPEDFAQVEMGKDDFAVAVRNLAGLSRSRPPRWSCTAPRTRLVSSAPRCWRRSPTAAWTNSSGSGRIGFDFFGDGI